MTLREAVQWGVEQLKNAPRETHARRDVEWLLLVVVGKDKAWLMAHGDDALQAAEFERFAELIERRATGEPMQYIVGECEFFGLMFKVGPAVLIPRPETEHLIEVVIEKTRGVECARIVDVGTGSGAIAVTLALKLKSAVVTAIDLSGDALSVARENAERNGARVRFLEGDLLEPVRGKMSDIFIKEKRKATADPSTTPSTRYTRSGFAQDDTSLGDRKKQFSADEEYERFDFVVSNPPYVPDIEKAWLSVDVRDHEPHLALFGGEDGLGIYRRLIPQAKDVLVSGGWLVMEMGFGQGERVQDLMEQAEFKEIEIVPDLQGIERIIFGRK